MQKEQKERPPKNKKEAIANWTQFNVTQSLAESLVANNFVQPTPV